MKTRKEYLDFLSQGDHRMLHLLSDLPLATVRELKPLSQISAQLVYRRLDRLRDRGLVDSASLG